MNYVRNAWFVAAWSHEVVPERPRGMRVLNEPIVFWRNQAGELAAFEDRCIHRLAPLSLGRCEGARLRCKYHGLLYDRTGRVVEIPGQNNGPTGLRVRTYPVAERNGWIWIWMGAAAADENLIPPLMDMEQPGCIFGHGQLDYAAEARLINDNLLDLSHASFLHTETFCVSETWARQHPNVTEHERSIRSERWLRSEGRTSMNDAELVDVYFSQDFFVPGALLMIDRRYPVGTADALNGQAPDLNITALDFTFSSQAVTPLTDKSARYFYIFGARPQGNENAFDMTTAEQAFAEDKAMIEAQQINIDTAPNRRFMVNASDRGAAAFNKLVKRLMREESTLGSSVIPSESGGGEMA